MDPQYAAQLIKAATARANLGGSPNAVGAAPGMGSQFQNLQNLSQLQFQEGATGAAVNGLAGESKNVTSNQDAQRSAAERMAEIIRNRDQKIAELNDQKAAEESDPKNYRKEISKDGGYNFFDAKGNPISVQQYAAARNERVTDVLKDSQDPRDKEYVSGFKQLSEMQAALRGSQDDEDKFFKANPQLKDKYNDLVNGGLTRGQAYYELVNAFGNHFKNTGDSSDVGLAGQGANIRDASSGGGFKWPWE